MTFTSESRIFLIIAATLSVAACGGSGGNAGTAGNSQAASAQVTGAAAKVLLLSAPVAFYAVTNGAVGATPIGTTRTDPENGTFSSTVTANGPVVVVVSADASTQMVDEISGQDIAAPTGLVMHAVFDSLTDLQPVAVTPLTELAYQLATKSSGGLNTGNIDAANNAISTVFLNGAPALYTQPIDLKNYATATVAQQAEAKILTAFAVAANDGTATDLSGQPCNSTYAANITCMITGLPALVSLNASGAATISSAAGYVSAAYAALDSDGVDIEGGQSPSSLGLDATTAAETAFDATYGSQNPVPGFYSSGNGLADTKALIANIRTNIVDQAATQTFGYAPTLNALQSDYKTNVAPIVESTAGLIDDLHTAALLLQAGVVNYRGHCGYDPSGLGTGSATALCFYDLPATQDRMLVTVTTTGTNTYSVESQPLDMSGGQCSGSFNGITFGCPVNTTYLPLQAQATWVNSGVESASFSGPYYVNGTGGQVTGSLSVAESSNWDTTTDTGTLTLSGQLSNGSGGVALTNATLGTDSVLQVQNLSRWTNGSQLIVAGLPPISVSGTVDLVALTTNAFSYAAKVVVGAPVLDKSGAAALPSSITATGSVNQINAGVESPLFNGSLGVNLLGVASFDATQPISPTNFFTAQAQVSGALSLPGGRVLTISAAANGSQTAPTPLQPISATVTYTYATPTGTAQLNATGQYDNVNGYSGTITSNAGVVISVQLPVHGTLSGTITAGGAETATINGDFVYYSDDSSESLF